MNTAQSDTVLLVELTVTRQAAQFKRCLQELRQRGWDIGRTPRDGEFRKGTNRPRNVPSTADS